MCPTATWWWGWGFQSPFLSSQLLQFFFFFFNFYLFLTALGIHCCTQAFPSCSKRGLPSSLGVQASHCGGPLVELRLSCLTACGFFPEQGSNPCPLPYQADS